MIIVFVLLSCIVFFMSVYMYLSTQLFPYLHSLVHLCINLFIHLLVTHERARGSLHRCGRVKDPTRASRQAILYDSDSTFGGGPLSRLQQHCATWSRDSPTSVHVAPDRRAAGSTRGPPDQASQDLLTAGLWGFRGSLSPCLAF